MRIPAISTLPILLSLLPACNLDIKHCIGDCEHASGGGSGNTSEGPGDTTDEPSTDSGAPTSDSGEPDTDTGGELGTCDVVHDALPATCGDGQYELGELCFFGTFGMGNLPVTSSLALPLDDLHGADLLMTMNDGTVRAELFAPLTLDTKVWPQSIGEQPILRASGDFDEDGVVDVLAHTIGPDGVSVHALFLDGEGGLADDQIVHLAENVVTLDAVDWNDDGHLDIITVAHTEGLDGLVVLLGDGTGEFTESVGPALEQATPGYVLGAIDGDGRADDFVFTQGGSGTIVRNNGNLQTTSAPSMPAELWFHDFVIADLDGDGFGDIAGVATNTEFETSELVVFLQKNNDFPLSARYPVNCGARLLAAGDLDNDGVLDIVTGGVEFMGSIRRGDGQGGFPQHMQIGLDKVNEGDALHIADFEGDGIPDVLVTGQESAALAIAYNRG